MKKFKVTGKIEIQFEIEVEAENSTDAENITESKLNDAYNLNVFGYYHDPKLIDISIHAREI